MKIFPIQTGMQSVCNKQKANLALLTKVCDTDAARTDNLTRKAILASTPRYSRDTRSKTR